MWGGPRFETKSARNDQFPDRLRLARCNGVGRADRFERELRFFDSISLEETQPLDRSLAMPEQT